MVQSRNRAVENLCVNYQAEITMENEVELNQESGTALAPIS